MDIMQNPLTIFWDDQMESRLPKGTYSQLKSQAIFVYPHDSRDCFWIGNIHQKMAMIGHDHKPMQNEWVKFLDSVQVVHSLLCKGRVIKYPSFSLNIGCDEHEFIILNGVPLEHGNSLGLTFGLKTHPFG